MKRVRAVFNFMCWFIKSTGSLIFTVIAIMTFPIWMFVLLIANEYEISIKQEWRTGNKWWFDSWNKSKKDET